MKKVMIILLSLLLMGASPVFAEQDAVIVVTTFYPLYVATINIVEGVPGVVALNMASQEAECLHDYQLTTADRSLLANADVLVMNGAGLEVFLDGVLPALSAQVVDASAGIGLLQGRHETLNPHVWVSIAGMKEQVKNIADGLSAVTPENAQVYAKNANAYIAKLSELEREMAEMLRPVAGQPIITFHEAFDYLARDYGLRVVAVMESDAGNAPSARELAEVVEAAKAENVKALFAEPNHQNVTVDVVARETGLPVYTLDPIVSGQAISSSRDAYIEAMRENAKVLLEALR